MTEATEGAEGAAIAEGAAWAAPSSRRVRTIRERLRLVYGVPLAQPHGDPIGELVLTVLSQSTNDRNRDLAYLALGERFSDWEAVRDAPLDQIEAAIRPGGISKVKSARIKAILRAVSDGGDGSAPAVGGSEISAPAAAGPEASGDAAARHGVSRELSLDWLSSVSVPDAQRYLVGLPGVGRKTAACVLLFAFGMRDVPVDTHVSRVGSRLELFRPHAPFEELHDTMLAITPQGQELELHLNLLRHGRRTCHARHPDCAGCALRRICPSASRVG